MSSRDFFSQYSRFNLGIDSAPAFAAWVLAHADELEPILDESEWDVFLGVELAAAECTGGHMSSTRFREVVDRELRLWPDRSASSMHAVRKSAE